MSDFCAFCGKELPANIRQVRHRTQDDLRSICCNREHEVERRKRDGVFKAMSEVGKEARSTAVAKSNKVNPRRKRKEEEMNNGLSGWKIEVRYNENDENEVHHVHFGPETPDERSELFVSYGFFETEKEAAQAFLQEVSEHPEARYSRTVYEKAMQLSH